MPTPKRKSLLALSASLLLILFASATALAQTAETKPELAPSAESTATTAVTPTATPAATPAATPKWQSKMRGFFAAQPDEPKLEVGVLFTSVLPGAIGGGGRLTYNWTKYIAVEGELNYVTDNSDSLQGQFGVKSGVRFKNRIGVFGKIRPGFVYTRFNNRFFYPAASFGTLPAFTTRSQTNFSMDLGGVVEFYASKRVLLRFDIGDTMVHQGSSSYVTSYPVFEGNLPTIQPIRFVPVTYFIPGGVNHNLQISAGVGFRF
jgi:hypothetical protein